MGYQIPLSDKLLGVTKEELLAALEQASSIVLQRNVAEKIT